VKKLSKICLLASLSLLSCNDDESTPAPNEPVQLTENVEVYNGTLIDDSYAFGIELGQKKVYLITKQGEKKREWNFDINTGNDVELMDNGKLMAMFRAPNPAFSFGGYGGVLKVINPNGTTDWEMTYADENKMAHHDFERLPNGNFLLIAWEKVSAVEAQQNGANTQNPIYPETIVEINPATMQVVWEWHSFDHIVQDHDSTKENFGVVANNPQLINVNYQMAENGNIMHANGIDYDAQKDVIYLSVNFFSEVWVIDHSTTTAQAASHSGGNFNKGGDLLYRFGNPEAYNNPQGTRMFYSVHHPNFLDTNVPGKGNVLVYNNGGNISQSKVYELKMPATFNLQPNTNNEPQVIWSFIDPELFYDRVSGASRLKNGNTLICEGGYGFWEVTPDGTVVWKYNGGGTTFWRVYGIEKNSPATQALGL
jgi:hypothetical protein